MSRDQEQTMATVAVAKQERCTVVIQNHDPARVRVPGWVEDLGSFRRWAQMEEFPENGRIDYLQGEVWVDMSTEQVFSHNQVKKEYSFRLTDLEKAGRLGRYF